MISAHPKGEYDAHPNVLNEKDKKRKKIREPWVKRW
jgi:hypothetical protein